MIRPLTLGLAALAWLHGPACAPGVAAQAGADGPEPYRLLPDSRFEVRTEASGMLSGMVHAHVVRADAFTGIVRYDPSRPARSSVEVAVPVDSLVVDTNADPEDRASIRETMLKEVLRATEHPTIRFRSTSVERAAGDSLRVTGTLTMAGETRSVTITLAHRAELGRLWVWGSFTTLQTNFDIEPYSAGLGTLRVADPVTFRIDAVAARDPNDDGR